ncbi:hypothetical protein JOC95_002347 [Bacillus tianshenii]|uniref:Uncharacterized protein n=1 Tax=Sutcliffiella tianshenii TaxID=1463404 RepID=A0ABS2P0T5_9BACI|nr:hypothetical protein [Bacillus tianshenii]
MEIDLFFLLDKEAGQDDSLFGISILCFILASRWMRIERNDKG